eukprot:CAMPEP_0202059194 /NCGR_PEP_ID=MMETSP0963-20130614/34405_1 /ASSEMBLY_ACC=CAM_ASM_000494 /TAXON_ID=4773 /ORGANISM="Schizochytrium aggregatum, Strain ATCC28209" /LENGTH=88 /DNA_ID=CAMNT_0048625225 /DNA_START=209 /DNA_END=472 /DNA_ORIENTATION=+
MHHFGTPFHGPAEHLELLGSSHVELALGQMLVTRELSEAPQVKIVAGVLSGANSDIESESGEESDLPRVDLVQREWQKARKVLVHHAE